ncbi:hypothetical protein GCM10023212_42960 [Luteolibacter yonseiensis]
MPAIGQGKGNGAAFRQVSDVIKNGMGSRWGRMGRRDGRDLFFRYFMAGGDCLCDGGPDWL